MQKLFSKPANRLSDEEIVDVIDSLSVTMLGQMKQLTRMVQERYWAVPYSDVDELYCSWMEFYNTMASKLMKCNDLQLVLVEFFETYTHAAEVPLVEYHERFVRFIK